MQNEEWRDAVGYEGLYQVSTSGRIKSNYKGTRIADKEEYIMRQKVDDKGYFRVNLRKDGRTKAELVSRLVATTYIPNPNNLPHVGHDDDNRANNHVSNLYWTHPPENNRHNGKLERFHNAHRAKINIIAKKLSQRVRGVSLDKTHTVSFDSIQDARRAGFDGGKISMCINGKRRQHGGYRWERID